MHATTIESGSVRIPAPVAGEVVTVRRYNRPQAVILHPDDYAALVQAEATLTYYGELEPLPAPTALEARVHLLETTPGLDVAGLEDYDALSAWLAAAAR